MPGIDPFRAHAAGEQEGRAEDEQRRAMIAARFARATAMRHERDLPVGDLTRYGHADGVPRVVGAGLDADRAEFEENAPATPVATRSNAGALGPPLFHDALFQ